MVLSLYIISYVLKTKDLLITRAIGSSDKLN